MTRFSQRHCPRVRIGLGAIGITCVTASIVTSSLLSAVMIDPAASHAQSHASVPSHGPSLDRLAGDLFYPRASERFFREGRQQLEQEIQRQQHPKTPPALKVIPERHPSLDPQPLPEEMPHKTFQPQPSD
jgi:hypothetical protein